MSRARSLVRFVWDFVVGDDWRIALGVVAALGITALVTDTSVSAWWILPVGVAAVLALSVWRAARS
ncbi:MAG TPA: hypothetical protein VGF70_13215 [Solirubrobacteraceae bacterium]|jgi:hypothetical protein